MTTKIKKSTPQEVEPVAIQKFDERNLEATTQIVLKGFATVLSNRNITPEALTSTFDQIKTFSSQLKKMEEMAKEHLKKIVEEKGEVKPESAGGKSKFLRIGEYQVEIRPQNTKLDDVKVESLLRNKGINLDAGMDKQIAYSINESKLADLVNRKKLTVEEIETCRHELKYTLQPPKKV